MDILLHLYDFLNNIDLVGFEQIENNI